MKTSTFVISFKKTLYKKKYIYIRKVINALKTLTQLIFLFILI